MVTVIVELTGNLGHLDELMKTTIKEGMSLTSQHLVAGLQSRSPVDHGLLKQWAPHVISDTEIHVKSPAYYAGWVNDGHPQQPGRFIPGSWQGDKFRYKPKAKTGMVLKKSFVPGKHFVEASINATAPRIKEFFTIKG
jgi:hypothetical protein